MIPRISLKALAPLLVVAACAGREEIGEGPRPTPIAPGDCAPRCAADGRAVVDCNEEIVTACDPSMSCRDAKCIPGCEAAVSGQSSVGCEYYAAKPSAYKFNMDGAKNDLSCYAVLIANTWNAPVELQVEYDGRPIASSYFRIPHGRGGDIRYDLLPEGKLPQGELAVLFLSMAPKPQTFDDPERLYVPCPESVGAAVIGGAAVRGTGFGKMFHIRTTAPVVAYDIYPYGGSKSFFPSSSLLLPTSAWGTENLAMDGYSLDSSGVFSGFSPYFQILARDNDTRVKIRPTTTLSGVAGGARVEPGEIGEYVLQSGQFLQFSQVEEINGTAVESDKPVSLVGGATCMTIPSQANYCDTLHQHLPPIRLFGDTYVATRYRDRDAGHPEKTPWRILAAATGTTLTYDPPIADAPATLERGQWKEFWAPGPFVVKSQDANHPIYVASYMTGAANVPSEAGDPEMVNVVPVGQYLSSYVFLTDPTYGNTNLVFVRGLRDGADKSSGARDDVELDCVGPVQGWQRVGNTDYEIAYVDLVKDGFAQGTCDNGVHRATSKSPFALTVWGWDRAASYGFPAGMGTKPLNDIPAIR